MLSLFLGLLQLVALFVLGELIADRLNLPIPGSIIGMLLFLCLLIATGKIRRSSSQGSQLLIANLILLILPSATGVFFLESRFTEQWLAIATVLIVGTVLSVLTSFLLFMALDSEKLSLAKLSPGTAGSKKPSPEKLITENRPGKEND